jgi:hypothetical protein
LEFPNRVGVQRNHQYGHPWYLCELIPLNSLIHTLTYCIQIALTLRFEYTFATPRIALPTPVPTNNTGRIPHFPKPITYSALSALTISVFVLNTLTIIPGAREWVVLLPLTILGTWVTLTITVFVTAFAAWYKGCLHEWFLYEEM